MDKNELRQETCQYISNNRFDFTRFVCVVSGDNLEHERVLDDTLKTMSKPNSPVGFIAVMALSRLLEATIVVTSGGTSEVDALVTKVYYGDTHCLSVISYPADVLYPLLSSDLFNHVCHHSRFSYPYVCFSVPIYDVYYTPFHLCLCGWCVLVFPRRIALLEVRMSCRLVFSRMFQCCP